MTVTTNGSPDSPSFRLTNRVEIAAIERDLGTVSLLVNNAGVITEGDFADIGLESQTRLIQINIVALTSLTRMFLPAMKRRGKGRILNVASIAAFLPGPGMAVYYASKAYVLSFSEALHSELKARGVRVCVLCPGPVPTEFAERAGLKGGLGPGFLTQSAERVAEAGYRGLMRKLFDLVGNDSEPLPGGASPGGLDGRVQSEQVCLGRDRRNGFRHFADGLR